MTDDNMILGLVARHNAIETELCAAHDEAAMGRLADEQRALENVIATLTPTTALAALEQVDLLGQHDEAGQRAIGVLRGIVSAAA
jgi:hypothetical protein